MVLIGAVEGKALWVRACMEVIRLERGLLGSHQDLLFKGLGTPTFVSLPRIGALIRH